MVTKLTLRQVEEQTHFKRQAAKEAVTEGMRQYIAILPASDPKAIDIMMELWRANLEQYISNCDAIDGLKLQVSVSGHHLAILRTLCFAPGRQMTLSDLCKVVSLRPAAATNFVDSLTRGSLVRRTCTPHSRHTNIVQLTPRGTEILAGIAGVLGESWTAACARLDEHEKETLIDLLQDVHHALYSTEAGRSASLTAGQGGEKMCAMASETTKSLRPPVEDVIPADWVEEGVRQYTDLLHASDAKAIAVQLALWRANHAQMVANSRAIDALNLPTNVTGTRLAVLRTLYFAPDKCLALSGISRAANISPTMVTNLVDGLARAGYVRRAGSPDDRRVSIAHLTPEGETTFLRVLPVMSQRMTDACASFTDEEKDTLLHLLQRLF